MAKNDASNAAQNIAVATTDAQHHLIVIHPFGTYNKGARIEDAKEIAAVLAGENAGSCNRINSGT
jgi:hypothetical protein